MRFNKTLDGDCLSKININIQTDLLLLESMLLMHQRKFKPKATLLLFLNFTFALTDITIKKLRGM